VYHYTTTSTTSLNDLAYVFKNRGNVNTTLIKNAFQKLYQARDFAIFDTFWNNAGLRGELFTSTIRSEALRDEFPILVNNLNSLLYSFINIK
jgi:hypothetical protein